VAAHEQRTFLRLLGAHDALVTTGDIAGSRIEVVQEVDWLKIHPSLRSWA
jgi:hypothetical protein